MQRMTNREYQILNLLVQGKNNRQIANRLSITLRTVKFHTSNIYAKLNLSSRSQVIVWFWRHSEQQELSVD